MSDTKSETKTGSQKDITSIFEFSKKLKDPLADAGALATTTATAPTESDLLSLEPQTEEKKVDDFLFHEFSAPEAPSTAPSLDSVTDASVSPPENFLADAPSANPVSAHPSESADPALPQSPLDAIKAFSENMAIGKPAVQPAFPFNLYVDGPLSSSEKEKLLDLITKHSMGIAEEDLKIQFERGHGLLPRISEFAGVLIVQALRGSRANFRLVPVEQVASNTEVFSREPAQVTSSDLPDDSNHPAESLPLTHAPSVAEISHPETIDTVTASATLKAQVVEASRSAEYQEVLEALKRELKYKAYRKGAQAIVHFSIHLSQLSSPTHYRLTVLGTAIREKAA